MGEPAAPAPSRRPLAALLLAALVAMAPAGCGRSTPAEPDATASATAASPPASPTATPAPASPRPATTETTLVADLVFTRSGGIAGLQEQLTIHPDGTVEARNDDGDTSSTRLPEGDLARLAAMLAEADLAALAGTVPTPDVADELYYGIAHQRLRVTLPSTAVPEQAVELVTRLDALLDQLR